MSILKLDFLVKYFGEIKFAEQNSLPINDFELAFKKHFSRKSKLPRGRYKFGEIDNSAVKDFTKSFMNYFE
ncbi:MAG: hypothetical protein KAW51_01065 [Candidatus Lokiarchaeota archaeon]|nr:hypothetical protein [Candidatus Lokiarchaeota archaeon]